MYFILAGTTDYYTKLLDFLSKLPNGFSLFEGKGGWKGKNLSAQLIIFFDVKSAYATQTFLLEECKQEDVYVYEVNINNCSQ